MSNNKQTMKLYTEEQVIQMIEKSRETGLTAEFLILANKGIELPSDEEIKTYLNNHSYEFEHGFKDAIEFIKNKIQGGNKWAILDI